MKPASTILALSVSCLPGFISPIAAQEEQPRQPDAQQQEEEKAGLLGFGEAEMILMLLHVAEAENAHDPADE